MTELAAIRRRVIGELVAAGFELQGGRLVPPEIQTKDDLRRRHEQQRNALLYKSRDFILGREDVLLEHFASGSEVDVARLDPSVEPVVSELDADIFRFAALQWSVPVSQGYGRRTRFLVRDRSNGKVMGLMALGDPVFNLGARDSLIGWDQAQRQERLYNVFDAFVLGAVEPYRQLLAGKLVALCAVAEETVAFLEGKYAGAITVIHNKQKESRPVLVTTTSALGKSSIYNRLRVNGRLVFQPVGYTAGFGHFQFSDALFEELTDLVSENDNYRGNSYGSGPNWKIRTIRIALSELGLSGDLLKHGIQRQVFLAPLAHNWAAYLRGETDLIRPATLPLEEYASFYRDRWAIPRAARRPEFREWRSEGMRLSAHFPGEPRAERLF